MYKRLRRSWKIFCREHSEGIEEIGYFLAGLSIFASLFSMYIVLWLFGF